jgi:hypothetical protein
VRPLGLFTHAPELIPRHYRFQQPRRWPHGMRTRTRIYIGTGVSQKNRWKGRRASFLRALQRLQTSNLPAQNEKKEGLSRVVRKVCEGKQTHLSRMASCQRCNFATSFIWKPKIRGRYLSARSATVAVLMASPRPSAPSTSSSRTRAPRRRGSSTAAAPAPGLMPTTPRAGSAGPLLGGRRAG